MLKLKSTDEYCYILFSAFNKFAEEPEELNAEYEKMDEDLVEIEKQL